MTTQPQWSPVDTETGDLLSLLADDGTLTKAAQWDEFTACLRLASVWDDGLVQQNRMRPLIKDKVDPRRVGPFYRRACLEGLIAPTGDWQTSNDHAGKNAGRPMRTYRWIGAPE